MLPIAAPIINPFANASRPLWEAFFKDSSIEYPCINPVTVSMAKVPSPSVIAVPIANFVMVINAQPNEAPPVIGVNIAPTSIIPQPIPHFIKNDFQLYPSSSGRICAVTKPSSVYVRAVPNPKVDVSSATLYPKKVSSSSLDK